MADQRWTQGGTATSAVVDRYGYTYDRNSNRLTRTNALQAAFSKTYAYDNPKSGKRKRTGIILAMMRMGVTTASRAVSVVPMPAGRGIASLADIPDRQCRDGFSQPMIRGEHAVVAKTAKRQA